MGLLWLNNKKLSRRQNVPYATVFSVEKESIKAEAALAFGLNKEDFRLVFMRGNEVPDDFNLISYLEGLKVKYLSKLPVKNKLYLISNEDITRRKYVFN